jgi:signal transduction histidine kinase
VHFGIKAKQIGGVSLIVGVTVIALSLLHATFVARVLLEQSRARAELLANTIFQRAKNVVPGQPDPWAAIREDGGLRAILESSAFARNVTYAAICNVDGVAEAAWDPSREGKVLPPAGSLDDLIGMRGVDLLWSIYASRGQTLEVRLPLLLGGERFGSIRIGVSTALVREEFSRELWLVGMTGLIALLIAVVVSAGLAQLILRPIHVIKSGLTRLGRGELGVRLDLPQQDEFGELGSFFNEVSAQMSAGRPPASGWRAAPGGGVGRIEDDVAVFSPGGEVLFANAGMLAALPAGPVGRPIDDLLPEGHPYRDIVHRVMAGEDMAGPVTAVVPGPPSGADGEDAAGGERVAMAHAVQDRQGRLACVLLLARDLAALGRVRSMLEYSSKLVALGRLSAGVAHEVKNPLNAMTIHLELLEQKLRQAAESGPGDSGLAPALEHVRVIGGEVQRLDQVMQGFIKFNRPEDLTLQPIAVSSLVEGVVGVIGPECAAAGVKVVTDGLDGLPEISGDPEMLRQALLNLALNARQAMPDGGTLRISAAAVRGRRVEIRVEDTGVGIKPEHLGRIFDLYFTTRAKGSGIGLSMVYRTVQLHDGEIEVQSIQGRGTTFRIVLPQAA